MALTCSRRADLSRQAEEGAFSMVTLWLIEALARAGAYDPSLLAQSVGMLEDFMGYTNHVDLLSEEISKGGEPLGNFPQVSSYGLPAGEGR